MGDFARLESCPEQRFLFFRRGIREIVPTTSADEG